jgi:hypothetical protein
MQQSCTYGSVRGAAGNRRSYRDVIHAAFDGGAASRRTALRLGQIPSVFSLVAPCPPGASLVSVPGRHCTTDCQIRRPLTLSSGMMTGHDRPNGRAPGERILLTNAG